MHSRTCRLKNAFWPCLEPKDFQEPIHRFGLWRGSFSVYHDSEQTVRAPGGDGFKLAIRGEACPEGGVVAAVMLDNVLTTRQRTKSSACQEQQCAETIKRQERGQHMLRLTVHSNTRDVLHVLLVGAGASVPRDARTASVESSRAQAIGQVVEMLKALILHCSCITSSMLLDRLIRQRREAARRR
jgi:hypothetical protein